MKVVEGDLQVKGDTRYMKIQNPGRAVGGWKTPLNDRAMENISVAILPAVSASGIAAISMCANVLVKTKNCTMSSSTNPWRWLWGIPPLVKIG